MHTKLSKRLGLTLAAALLALPLAACGTPTNQKAGSTAAPADTKKTVYTTFFPVYDLTKTIVGDKMNVEMIITGNQEPHDFELQASDMGKISESDLIIYNGAGMEAFIDDLKEAAGDENKFLDLSEGLTLLKSDGEDEHEHDHAHGDADDHEHEHGDADEHDHDEHAHDEHADHDEHDHEAEADEHEHGEEHEHHHHGEFNPHTWLSIKNAKIELNSIYEKVAKIDPENADYYKENLESASVKFDELDKKFEKELSSVPADQRYLVVSHAAFNYLANDYGLKQLAVTGISPEEEPSAQQLATIADFVADHQISTIFFEGKATPKVAETLAKNTGVKTDSIYTLESATDEEMELGYLGLMERNLDAIMKSFNK